MATNTSTTSIQIPDDLLGRFNRLAGATGRTRSYHLIKALEAYIGEQEYLVQFFAGANAEANADPTAAPNAEAIAVGLAAGLLRAEDLEGPDPVSDEEYEAAQRRGMRYAAAHRDPAYRGSAAPAVAAPGYLAVHDRRVKGS